ncbi:hypothetical protein K437DRAFT_156609 [Tilletiaria anomala UBC 951]|uniref:Uncharacterized protein n=1 Tax=Tilletiaria anomala (strain ATCC 24038 / CBS 436.72 / UBC 951) TaxID=1037660 RepID=A0A066VRI3_TILAU|nr:uncharacterized protein K437DRAFT_156609 [Tilletiaria anomala UBC 951]KDN42853.1 hypothetical protein K437DRAFT_156609 [Tilletiaria anomala UBC 951]
MQSADPATLFQTDASLATGLKRALKWKHTSSGAQWGSPIWLSTVSSATAVVVAVGDADGANKSRRGADADGGGEVQAAADAAGANEVSSASTSTSSSTNGLQTHIVTDRLGKLQVDEDVRDRAARGVGTDGGKCKVLSMEILQEEQGSDSADGIAFVAEGGGSVRAVHLETARSLATFRAGTGACFCLGRTPLRRRLFVACGSWDKALRIYGCSFATPSSSDTTLTAAPPSAALKIIPNAASDFIKALAYDDASQLLLSGGTDLHVRAWDLQPLLSHLDGLSDESWRALARNGAAVRGSEATSLLAVEAIGNMRLHTRPINKIVILPSSPLQKHAPTLPAPSESTILSADSMGRILESTLIVRREQGQAPRASFQVRRELRGHETSVNDMRISWLAENVDAGDADDGDEHVRWSCCLWTASSDKSAKRFDLDDNRKGTPHGTIADRSSKAGTILGDQPPLFAAQSIEHTDYVQSILPLPAGLAPATKARSTDSLVVTGSSDENVYLWDAELASQVHFDDKRRDLKGNALKVKAANGTAEGASDDASLGLVRRQEGHWHEVTALGLWRRKRYGVLADETNGSATDESKPQEAGWWIITASYDGSIRRWPLGDLLNPAPADAPSLAALLATAITTPASVAPSMQKAAAGAAQMTTEEEAELAELMSDEE